MADYVSVMTPNSDLTVADYDGRGPGTSTDLSTGDIRRKYNFGSRVSELAIPQDPFFRFLNMAAKKPTDDPQRLNVTVSSSVARCVCAELTLMDVSS